MNLSTVLSPENFEYLTKILLVRNESLVSSNAPFPSMFSSYGNRSLFSLWKDDGSLIKFVKNHFFNGISYILWHVFFFFFSERNRYFLWKKEMGKKNLPTPAKNKERWNVQLTQHAGPTLSIAIFAIGENIQKLATKKFSWRIKWLKS